MGFTLGQYLHYAGNTDKWEYQDWRSYPYYKLAIRCPYGTALHVLQNDGDDEDGTWYYYIDYAHEEPMCEVHIPPHRRCGFLFREDAQRAAVAEFKEVERQRRLHLQHVFEGLDK